MPTPAFGSSVSSRGGPTPLGLLLLAALTLAACSAPGVTAGTTPTAGASGGGSSSAGEPGMATGAASGTGASSGAGTTGGAGSANAAGQPPGGGAPQLEGAASRPQLASGSAADFTVLKYLNKAGPVSAPQSDGWDPTAGVNVTGLVPKYRVAKTGGSHASVQAAIDAAVNDGGTTRIGIEVGAGIYREVVCVPSSAPPITLFGASADASAAVIVFDNYSGKTKAADAPANPCNPSLGSTSYGTSGSSTFAAYANGFQAKNLTIENDTDETGLTGNVQAVALATQGDQQIYENVRLLGNQDTFMVKTPGVDVITRVYVKSSFIQGDTDFIFGRAVLVIEASEIRFISTRQGSKGYAIVPSTDARNPYGILVYQSQFTADDATQAGQIHLGRAWDESGKDLPTYAGLVASGVYPNGQALIRESTLGAHVRASDPWAEAATTKRPFSTASGTYPANRLFELGNTGPGAAK
jgi:pectinesterase